MKVHLIGVGGIGVSALARYFLSQGWEVSGSDGSPSPLLRELKGEGAKIKIGHHKSNLDPKTDLVIYTQATLRDNPELREAKRLKVRTLSYPKALGELTKRFTTIALAGTHGKSTATALTALTLLQAKMDPTVVVGTKVSQLKGKNFRLGKSKYLVVEADEYKDAFLNYYPHAALITNIDREHLDYFKNLNRTKQSFLKFINNLESSGVLVLNKDNSPLLSLKNQPRFAKATRGKKIIWYSLKEKALTKRIKKHLRIPGEHNLSNALGVYKLAKALGIKEKDALKAFSRYHGAWRRMELRGNFLAPGHMSLVPIYDDYAHHPTEIKATLSAFQEKFPKAKTICVFQPHQAERLNKLFKEFASAFDAADTLILLDTFKVKGREKHGATSKEQRVNSKTLAEAVNKRKSGPKVIYLPRPSLLRNSIQNLLKTGNLKLPARGGSALGGKIHRPQAVVIMMGAGDIVDLTPRLLK